MERTVLVDLGDGVKIAVRSEGRPDGTTDEPSQISSAGGIVARGIDNFTASLERTSKAVLDAIRRAGPSSATVELSFGIAVEEGQVVALFGKGKAEAGITVTLEWSGDAKVG